MFGNIKKDSKESCVGIDIGTYAIKVLQISNDGDQLHLDTYGELEMAAYDALPPGSITNLGEEKVMIAIRDLFAATKITANKVVFSIPMQDCFVSTITIPKVSDKELASLLPIEARKYLPLPVSQVKLNYWRTDIRSRGEEKDDTVVIAAIKNETFDLYNKYAIRLGLKDFSFEIECLSQARIVSNALKVKESDPVLCVDIGGKASFVSLLYEGNVKVTNFLQKGSYENTFQISKILGLSIDVAEEAKRVFGYLGDSASPHLSEVNSLASFPLFDEIKHLLLGYERKYNINIEKVVLTGGGALQKGIKGLLSDLLGKEVVLLDVFAGLNLAQEVKDAIQEVDTEYAVAAGLALKNYFL